MSRQHFDPFREQQQDSAAIDEARLMCGARGCPARWSVDAGEGRLCCAHAWASRADWASITQKLQDDLRRRALDKVLKDQEPLPPQRVYTAQEKRAMAAKLRNIGNSIDPKAWARELKAREESGELLPMALRDMWRAALGHNAFGADEADKTPGVAP